MSAPAATPHGAARSTSPVPAPAPPRFVREATPASRRAPLPPYRRRRTAPRRPAAAAAPVRRPGLRTNSGSMTLAMNSTEMSGTPRTNSMKPTLIARQPRAPAERQQYAERQRKNDADRRHQKADEHPAPQRRRHDREAEERRAVKQREGDQQITTSSGERAASPLRGAPRHRLHPISAAPTSIVRSTRQHWPGG